MPSIRVIRLKFDRQACLFRAKIEMMPPDDPDESRAVGESAYRNAHPDKHVLIHDEIRVALFA